MQGIVHKISQRPYIPFAAGLAFPISTVPYNSPPRSFVVRFATGHIPRRCYISSRTGWPVLKPSPLMLENRRSCLEPSGSRRAGP